MDSIQLAALIRYIDVRASQIASAYQGQSAGPHAEREAKEQLYIECGFTPPPPEEMP